jgi:hypothetical protein
VPVRSHSSRTGLAAVLLVLGLSGCGGSALSLQETDASPTASAVPSTSLTSAAAAPRRHKRRTPSVPSPTLTVPSLSIPPSPTGPILGGDVSWPQCPKGMGIPQKRSLGLPMPLESAEFVLLGLTNGPGFTPNPCLASQVAWVRQRRLWAAAYAVHSYPDAGTLARYGGEGPFDGDTRLGALRNVGYQQALFNLDTMRGAQLQTPIVWLDVEPVPIFVWSADREANAAVIFGAARGYTDAGFKIGAYSTPALWEGVVGGLRLGIPEWRAAGQTSREEALSRCGQDWVIQGGRSVLGQWVESGRDRDITCPGTSTQMERWFHRYQ